MTWQADYQSVQGCVSWEGYCAQESDEFDAFLQGPVSARLYDVVGHDTFTEHLRGLSLTGMGEEALEEVLSAEVRETRDWATGEALAEAVLEMQYEVVLPWNNERDKRNPFASLPGADIVGFQRDGESYRLALGEVKSSSEAQSPPQVMSGRSGMSHQLETLSSDLAILCQLLKWLLPRVKGSAHETEFNSACERYFNSGKRDLVLFGVLIRDKAARETDLQKRGRTLAGRLQAPSRCHLLALYLPWAITQLTKRVEPRGGI